MAKIILEHFHVFGCPHKVVTDAGPYFRGVFSEFLRCWDILHRHTSTCPASSYGPTKRGVQLVKEVMAKKKNIMKEDLAKLFLEINQLIQLYAKCDFDIKDFFF